MTAPSRLTVTGDEMKESSAIDPEPMVPARAGTDRPERAAEPAGAAPVELRADCIADSAGGLTFDLNAPQETPGAWSAALVLRLRGGDGADDEVRLPLGPNGAGRLRAVLPSTVPLAEGRWNAYADLGDGQDPRRLLPGLNDLRSLVDRRPLAGIGRLGVRIPYATKFGNLALRSWRRGPHAEAGDILVAPDGMTVSGRLYGAAPGAGARAEARARRDAASTDAAPATVTVPLTVEGTEFTFTLPYEELAARWEQGSEPWDLWLRPAEGARPVRLARLLDDVADKKQVFSYPALPVPSGTGRLRVGPYYTLDNDLAVRVAGPAED
ncbi:hypothetical protein AB0G60_27640 [Streptomyces angustmyceticus]|uniref:Transferase n=1 Tax=Streptomyces angustmyceticus TaxID=285578 RepID=A0A5J4LM29_9ACTN|nr:hypothetical protein [Streptomyces angustmyceticus]UAL69931.1 hypothetical protein K7396_28085 [Streptomyces angustmyceticus]GES33081.1 hypothetical protein San01_55690 [Streptomyces angustmyceticus]